MTKKLAILLSILALLPSCIGSQRVKEVTRTSNAAIVFLGSSDNTNDLNIFKDTVGKRINFDERRINEKNAIERNTVIMDYVYLKDSVIISSNITETRIISERNGEVSANYFLLMDKNGKFVKRAVVPNGYITSFFLEPGEYKLILYYVSLSKGRYIGDTSTTSLNFSNKVIGNFSVKPREVVYLGHIDTEVVKINRNVFRRFWNMGSLKTRDFDYVISVQDRREDIPKNIWKLDLETRLIEINSNKNSDSRTKSSKAKSEMTTE